MEFFKPRKDIDFMRVRGVAIGVSTLLCVLSVIGLFFPGPELGTDFAGGTELQLRFRGAVSSGTLRTTLTQLGFEAPDVVAVQGRRNEYIVRVSQVSSLTDTEFTRIRQGLRQNLTGVSVQTITKSPGGEKISLTLSGESTPEAVQAALEASGARVRGVNAFGKPQDFAFEAHLVGLADDIVEKLGQRLGQRGPEAPLRVEWVGPRAGAQLRDAALKSILYAIVFIMVYVAFRFDLRFAPGGVLALLHDAIITLGVYVVLRREVNLTTVAAILTVIGFSINDTIVVFDRIRENMTRMKDKSLREIINTSTTQTLSRTIITSGTVIVSMAAFLFTGTAVIQEFAFALVVGVGVGTYSSIYIAAPMTEWIDTKYFRKA